MPRSRVLDFIQLLDPEKNSRRITYLSTCYDFPFDTTRSLEIALFRTFCVPSIAALLDSTGEFKKRPQRRYDDTDLIVSELIEYGYDSERGREALRRMNRAHGHYVISNDDYLYILSTFVFEPIRWNARFGWRPMTRHEKLAWFYFWRTVGHYMNIKDIPAVYEQLEQYNVCYERQHFRYSEANHRIAEYGREMFLSWFPAWTRPFGKHVIYAMMDDALVEAVGFPKQPPWLRRSIETTLKLRGMAARYFPRRRRPRLRTAMKHRSYPHGYQTEQLGPDGPAYSSPYLRKRTKEPVVP